MDIVALYHSLTLADLLPWIAAVVFGATALLRVMPVPSSDSSSSYVQLYGLVHLLANFKNFVNSPQFAPAQIASSLGRIEAAIAAIPSPAIGVTVAAQATTAVAA